MVKATKKAAAAKPAAPVEEAPKPRLVGDEVADVGVTAAAGADPGSQPGAGDALAHLNGRLAAFEDNLGALGITIEDGHSDPFDVAIAAIVAARGQADELGGKEAALVVVMHEAGFTLGEDENVFDAAAAEIGRLGKFDRLIAEATVHVELGVEEHRLSALIRAYGEAQAKIAELTAEEGETSADARKAHKAAVKGIAELFADLPDTAAITLRFAEGAEFIRQVPPIDVDRAQLLTVGSKVALDRRIEFDPGMPPAFVTHAFLIAGRKTLRCDIGPLRIGGGASAAIPAGYLEF